VPNVKKSAFTGKFESHAIMVDRVCENCGVSFKIKLSSLKYGRGRCCSRNCVDQNKSRTYLGENNPMHGKYKPRTELELFRLKMLNSAKKRAKDKGLEFDLELEDIVVPQRCPLLDIPLKFGNKTCHANSPTLDRINPTMGYVKGNIQVISHKANTIKSNATISELILLTERLYELYGKDKN